MTMAPGRKKRSFLIEIIFISVLLFLLMGSRSQQAQATGSENDLPSALPRSVSIAPLILQ